MSDAPERIVLMPDARIEQSGNFLEDDGVVYIRADKAQADTRLAVAEAYRRAMEEPFPEGWREAAQAAHAGPGLKVQRTWAAGYNTCRDAMAALADQDALAQVQDMHAELARLRKLDVDVERLRNQAYRDGWVRRQLRPLKKDA